MTCTCGAQGLEHLIGCVFYGKKYYKPYSEYLIKLEERLIAGAKAYGNKSFDKDSHKLIGEIQEEILDIAGWSYILWQRLETLKQQTKVI